MTLRIPAKVLIHVWSYDFYDMTLSTGKQRRHMINVNKNCDGYSSGTLVISTYVGCPDIRATVTPDLKCPYSKGKYIRILYGVLF